MIFHEDELFIVYFIGGSACGLGVFLTTHLSKHVW